MDTNAFNPDFVTAVNARGEKQRIPAHYLDHPVLGRGFRLPPSTLATPSMSWNREQLDERATALGLDAASYATKADVLDAITNHQTTSPTPGEDETPVAGDDEEN